MPLILWFPQWVNQGEHHRNGAYYEGMPHQSTYLQATIRFTDSCRYDLESRDQYDWNKLIGLFDGYFNNPRSVRWGWRWSTDNNCLEIAPYIHHDNQIVLPQEDQIIQVPLNQAFTVSIQIKPTGYLFKYFYNGNTIERWVALDLVNTYQGDCYFDSLYFGGSSPAPHLVWVDYRQVIVR